MDKVFVTLASDRPFNSCEKIGLLGHVVVYKLEFSIVLVVRTNKSNIIHLRLLGILEDVIDSLFHGKMQQTIWVC